MAAIYGVAKELEKLDSIIDYTKNYSKYNLLPSKALISLSGAAYSQNKNLVINGIEDLYGKKVIIIKGSIAEKVLSKHSKIELVLRENIKEMINTLYRKEGDIIIAISANMNYMINKL